HSVDIWNVIEAFRENGLNTLEPQTEVNVSRLEMLVSSLYHNLNKRLPLAQQVHVESLSSLLLNWLLSAYAIETLGRIRVFSIKVALATMCAGKLMDKLRYIFSQLCDGNGHMVAWKFSEYLREVLCLPAAVYESPSFSYNDNLATDIFSGNGKVTVNDFMDTMMSDPGPHCLVWFPLLHRLTSVENVVHPTVCDACQRENFTGFRYRCQKCHSFQMCQDCFWRGRVSSSHTIEHEVKEYTSYKSPSKQIGHSLRKSFRCVPEKGKASIPRFPDEPEKTINLSHIVPPSPLPSHNGFPDAYGTSPYDVGSLDSRSNARSPGKYTGSLDCSRMDDEHKLIARYAARLAAESRNSPRSHICERQRVLPAGHARIYASECKGFEFRALLRHRRSEILRVWYGNLREISAILMKYFVFVSKWLHHCKYQLFLLCIDEFVCKQSKISSRKLKEDNINEYFSRDNLSELSEDDGERNSDGPSGDRSNTNEPRLYESNNVNLIENNICIDENISPALETVRPAEYNLTQTRQLPRPTTEQTNRTRTKQKIVFPWKHHNNNNC
ncbi:hypothetical protein J6590_100517, partial [Homalodisca vitripennis]